MCITALSLGFVMVVALSSCRVEVFKVISFPFEVLLVCCASVYCFCQSLVCIWAYMHVMDMFYSPDILLHPWSCPLTRVYMVVFCLSCLHVFAEFLVTGLQGFLDVSLIELASSGFGHLRLSLTFCSWCQGLEFYIVCI